MVKVFTILLLLFLKLVINNICIKDQLQTFLHCWISTNTCRTPNLINLIGGSSGISDVLTPSSSIENIVVVNKATHKAGQKWYRWTDTSIDTETHCTILTLGTRIRSTKMGLKALVSHYISANQLPKTCKLQCIPSLTMHSF